MADRTEQILTPSQLNTLARDLLEGSFPWCGWRPNWAM